jgi:acyl dehydratase
MVVEERAGGGEFRPGANAGHHGRITDEGIRAMRSRIGIPVPAPRGELYSRWNLVSKDAIKIWALAMGDVNPLYQDRTYAEKTRWGGMIAPPTLVESAGIGEGRHLTPEEREEGRGGGLPGVHGWHSGETFEWYLPMRENDTLHKVTYLADVQVKHGQMAGRQVLVYTETIYRNQHKDVVCKRLTLGMRAERDAARETGKYKYDPHIWTDEELAEIDAAYESERQRGAEPRYWEDVTVGMELDPLVRGPFTGTDAVAFKLGWGEAFVRTGRHAYQYRKAHPLGYSRSWLNIPDVVERVHWEHDFAREVGTPGFYDYGPQRTAWMGNLLTNWIGDDGWVKKMSLQVRRFNVEGDVQWYKGRVTEKYLKDGEYTVECELWAENQRGEITAPGTAVVLLPSRAGGPVILPAQGQPPYPTWDGPSGKVVPVLAQRR